MKTVYFLLSIVYILGFYLIEINGHAYFSAITIDGVVHSEGDCMRPHPEDEYDYPISALDRPTGLTSADMTCGWLPAASRAANKKCAVNLGSQVILQWHYEMGLGSSDTFIIDPSHKGPCIVYMAKSDTGSGPVWFKIFQDGYDTKTKKWCVDKMRANGGRFNVSIPTDITPGNYLFRGELIALHEGDQLYGAQPYVGCAELTVGGSGTVNPSNLVTIPGVYSATDPGIHFDIYTGGNPVYPIPGPALYVSSSGTGSTPTPVTTKAAPITTKAAPVTTKAAPVTTKAAPVTTKAAPVTTKASQVTTGASITTGSSRGSSTTGKITTGTQSVTTAKPASVTTGTPPTVTTGSSTQMCYLPGTPNVNGKINSSPPTCGVKSKKARCSDGLCCSKYGYCGPIMETDGKYYEEMNGVVQVVTAEYAFSLYCVNNTGDYRKVPCSSVGLLQSENLESSIVSAAVSIHTTIWMFALVLLGIALH